MSKLKDKVITFSIRRINYSLKYVCFSKYCTHHYIALFDWYIAPLSSLYCTTAIYSGVATLRLYWSSHSHITTGWSPGHPRRHTRISEKLRIVKTDIRWYISFENDFEIHGEYLVFENWCSDLTKLEIKKKNWIPNIKQN